MTRFWKLAGRRQLSAFLCCVIFLLLGLSCAGADAGRQDTGYAALFAEANDYFRQANESTVPEEAAALYRKALVRFEKIVQSGNKNGKLYYNIGNTYFRLNDLGRAILNYKRAERLIGSDENLRQNLAYALSRQPDKIELKQEERILKTVLFWHYDIPLRARLLIFAVCNALLWGVLAVRFFWPRFGLGWPIAISVTLVLLVGGSVAYELTAGAKAQGVLVSQEVVARKGDGAAYNPSFEAPLHAGLVFSLLEDRGDWLHVELENGQNCWVPRGSAELL